MKYLLLSLMAILMATNIDTFGQKPSVDSKIFGMLIGSAIGDAAGGPVEFIAPPERSWWTRSNEPITEKGILELANSFIFRQYPEEPEPYAQFEPSAPPGSVTDDTRWKMIFFDALKEDKTLDKDSFARCYWDFREKINPEYDSICTVWQEEYGYVMNYYLQQKPAYPPERIWGGIPTMAGQMAFLPVAALFPGDPLKAYTTTWEINIIDVGYAKDITASIVAGLSAAMSAGATWENVWEVMKNTDPYAYNSVPWVPRITTKWIDKADEMIERSNGVISELFDMLENELEAVTWWEAHVPLCISLAFLKIVDYNPLAAMQLCIEFGHDTDSYAQLVGAFAGAYYGDQIFSPKMIEAVNETMQQQYNQDISDWLQTLHDINFR